MGITNFDTVQANAFIGGAAGYPSPGAKTYFVNNGTVVQDGGVVGANGQSGLSPLEPLATITAALALCVSGRGDHVVVFPGTYEETVTVTKDYITITGALVSGYAKPDIAPTTGKALYLSGAQGLVLNHLRFAAPAEDTDLALLEGNGGRVYDCVFDGDSTQGNAKGLIRFKGKNNDDSYTASEWKFYDCLFRGSGGVGLALDVGDGASNQVGSTNNEFYNCVFVGNDQEDILAVDTSAGGAHSVQDSVWSGCKFITVNKATYIDLDTTNGATNSGNQFAGCYFSDNTIDTTAIKVATANGSIVGCFGMDGVIDGDALD